MDRTSTICALSSRTCDQVGGRVDTTIFRTLSRTSVSLTVNFTKGQVALVRLRRPERGQATGMSQPPMNVGSSDTFSVKQSGGLLHSQDMPPFRLPPIAQSSRRVPRDERHFLGSQTDSVA